MRSHEYRSHLTWDGNTGGGTPRTRTSRAERWLSTRPGGGRFEEVNLRPTVTIASGDPDEAARLHQKAHEQCFLAASCRVPIRHRATIRVAEPA